MDKELLSPELLFEISWEVCNKVGGIHTVLASKALTTTRKLKGKYILIGPDFQNEYRPEFDEDPDLLKSWKQKAYEEGLRIRIGRWKVKGNPIAVLVDFSSFIGQKNTLLQDLWDKFRVDSISGQWDYVEPVLFGYACGRVIETYVRNFCKPASKVIAHFHEWMTASGGLYLKAYCPRVPYIFTTHATVMGRSIAGNNMPLYEGLKTFQSDTLAQQMHVMAKHSIEKTAAHHADCFTTVSEITARECLYLLDKEPDLITPNGFEQDMVWPEPELTKKRTSARQEMIRVAETALEFKYGTSPLIVCTSGRYEFRNKGLDVFIDALSQLQADPGLDREILAYILVPAWNLGPRKDLQNKLLGKPVTEPAAADDNLTHVLGDDQNDQILKKLRETALVNHSGKVKVIYVPAYLNGEDGIFNRDYYEIMAAADVTVFPSYYEPWGYTPLESIAFGVPTVTTDLAGFGMWIENHSPVDHRGVTVMHRTDSNDSQVTHALADMLLQFAHMDSEAVTLYRECAKTLSLTALWENLIDYYYQSYDIALDRAVVIQVPSAVEGSETERNEQPDYILQQLEHPRPNWTRVFVQRPLPEKLRPLEELTKNLWWSWAMDGRSIFEGIDNQLWKQCEKNPILFLDRLSYQQIQQLESDQVFLKKLDDIYLRFKTYMSEKEKASGPRIAYFSMEYGIHSSLKIYSGGLGILAGDYLKEASDRNIPMVAVGLLYRYGYFTQKISASGEQEENYEAQNFDKLPITPVRDKNGSWISIRIAYPGRDVTARIWRCDVGRTELYLLDTDHELNLDEDRTITHYLYGGDWENRLKQEVLLGAGSIKALDALGIEADVFHCNEGHAAFTGLHRIIRLIQRKGLSFGQAFEVVRSTSLFTTHTPVPAGHDAFSEDLLRQYMSQVPKRMNITWQHFMNLGKTSTDPNEKFSMSFLACNLSQEVNGVSWLHGLVSREILGDMWPGYLQDELHIGYVTNGVHFPTWAAYKVRNIYNRYFGDDFASGKDDHHCWQNIWQAPDDVVWEMRMFLKNKLINYIRHKLKDNGQLSFQSPGQLVRIKEHLKAETLTIGFARRFATYKRAYLLFENLDRLDRILNNPQQPVQLIFAGKAHPADEPGQEIIKKIVEIAATPRFAGKILFLENYDMEIARRMVQGVDVWLNTPTRPQEASGTSGEKAVMNGVLHFSVLDGWWVEGYKEGGGWMLPMENAFSEQTHQDELDAEMIYSIIEEEIVPLYYNRTSSGIPEGWISRIKTSIAEIASQFTTTRMIEDYQSKYYNKLAARGKEIMANDYALAKEIAQWKQQISRLWDHLNILEVRQYDMSSGSVLTDRDEPVEVTLYTNGIDPNDIGVELVLGQHGAGPHPKLLRTIPLSLVSAEGSIARYAVNSIMEQTGSFDVAVRVYPKNEYLPHRMDFALVKWA